MSALIPADTPQPIPDPADRQLLDVDPAPIRLAPKLITVGADDAPVCTDGVCLP